MPVLFFESTKIQLKLLFATGINKIQIFVIIFPSKDHHFEKPNAKGVRGSLRLISVDKLIKEKDLSDKSEGNCMERTLFLCMFGW